MEDNLHFLEMEDKLHFQEILGLKYLGEWKT